MKKISTLSIYKYKKWAFFSRAFLLAVWSYVKLCRSFQSLCLREGLFQNIYRPWMIRSRESLCTCWTQQQPAMDKLHSNASAKCSGGTVDSVLLSPAVISLICVASLFWLYKLGFYFFFFFAVFCSFPFSFCHFPPDCIWRWCCVVSFPGLRPCIVDDSFTKLVFNDALCSMA